MTPEELDEIEHNTILMWGKNKGKQLRNVPASYLLWFNEQEWSTTYEGTKAYVEKFYNELVQRYRQETGKNWRPRQVVNPTVPVEPRSTTYLENSLPSYGANQATQESNTNATIVTIIPSLESLMENLNLAEYKKERIVIVPEKESNIHVLINDERAIEL